MAQIDLKKLENLIGNLTLQVIGLTDEVEALKAENAELRKRIAELPKEAV